MLGQGLCRTYLRHDLYEHKQPGNIGAFLALLAAGPLVGFAVSRFLKKKPFPDDQARQIVYYLTKDVSNGKYYRADAAGLLIFSFCTFFRK